MILAFLVQPSTVMSCKYSRKVNFTLPAGLTVAVVTLSESGVDTVELSGRREPEHLAISTTSHTKNKVLVVKVCYQGCFLSPHSALSLLKHLFL